MPNFAEWIAPAATMIAAIMTASNLGARLTGWGFVVFTAGSICWTIVGVTSGQAGLALSNGFLILVNGVGIWRWLGRQSAYEDGGKGAAAASRKSSAPSLFTATGIAGMPVIDATGERLGKAVEALIECTSGEISYVVVATSANGLEEQLRAVPAGAIRFGCEGLALSYARSEFETIEILEGKAWPVSAETRV